VWTIAYTHSLLKKYNFNVGPFFGKNGVPLNSKFSLLNKNDFLKEDVEIV
jgi:hypothetical protein